MVRFPVQPDYRMISGGLLKCRNRSWDTPYPNPRRLIGCSGDNTLWAKVCFWWCPKRILDSAKPPQRPSTSKAGDSLIPFFNPAFRDVLKPLRIGCIQCIGPDTGSGVHRIVIDPGNLAIFKVNTCLTRQPGSHLCEDRSGSALGEFFWAESRSRRAL
jgi:hypothetical protein